MRWLWRCRHILALILLSWLTSGSACAAAAHSRQIHIAEDAVVEAVNCEQWERWSDKGRHVWRANFGAVIETDTGPLSLKAGDVFENIAPELWFTIEWKCSPEYGAGIWDAQ